MVWRWTLLGLALAVAAGCVTTIRPPDDPSRPVDVALIDYGRHASLVLPRPEGGAVEFAYGEWEWFALGNDAWYRVFPALCWPTQGALGRRALAAAPAAATIPAEERLVFRVGRAEAEALRARLEARWAESPGPRARNLGLDFVKDERSYGCFTNCNTVLADWLQELGCDVSGSACLANFRLVGSD